MITHYCMVKANASELQDKIEEMISSNRESWINDYMDTTIARLYRGNSCRG